MKKIIFLIQKELLQVSRDRNMLRIIFVIPLVQLLILGYAITTDVKNLDLILCDFDHSNLSRDLMNHFSYTEYFHIVPFSGKNGEIEKKIRAGRALIALVIPDQFGKEIEKGSVPEIQILLDGQNSNTSAVALGYCNRILLQFARKNMALHRRSDPFHAVKTKIIRSDSQVWYNPELKSVYYMIPGIISILLTIITMLLTGLAIVRERELGTLEQLMVTPVKSWQLIAGKTIPFAILGFIEMGIAMTFGVLWFKVPFLGNLAFMTLLAAVFILTTLGLGIFISTLVNTQQQALFISWFFLVCFILLSGFFYPLENMPAWIQWITYINPLRYFIQILRELFLKGAGLTALWPELAALSGMGIGIFFMAVIRFKKRIT
ncbi:MAG: ABC transporter permease [Candidatus Aureabacteria bacterium]|nr:ABC transporter permease [Candidatus Auribacterota bacterium]